MSHEKGSTCPFSFTSACPDNITLQKVESRYVMQRYNPGYAQHIKAQLADYLLEEYKSEGMFIAAEVPVEGKASIIDMMLVRENELIGFEIKSDYDSSTRLSKQMESYYGAFNSIYLVCGANYSSKARNSVRQGVGILSVDENGIKRIRKARQRQYPEKQKLVNFLWKKDIPYSSLKSEMSVEELKDKLVADVSKAKLLELVVQALTSRYYDRFDAFMKARGKVTCIQDVDILTIQNHYVY